MNGVARFKEFIERFGWIGGLAAAGSALAPLITAAIGFAPAWPVAIEFVTSLFMLIMLMVVFAYPWRQARRTAARRLIVLALVFAIVFGAYLFALDQFVVDLDGRRITLGCGWSADMIELSGAAAGQCPGQRAVYVHALEGWSYDETLVWGEGSIRQVRFGLLAGWLLSFVTLTALIGLFVLSLSRGERSRAAPEAGPVAAYDEGEAVPAVPGPGD